MGSGVSGLIKTRLRKAAALALGQVPRQGPHFFIVGATRSGTTWLHHALREHPDIFMPNAKELAYFNRDRLYRPDLAGYRSRFWGYRGERVVGEATPLYMTAGAAYDAEGRYRHGRDDDAIARIGRHFPDARLIVSLRDPATRIFSMFEKDLRQRKFKASLEEDLERELAEGRSFLNLIYHNDYRLHLEGMFAHFPSERVLVLVFEEWRDRSAQALARIHDFLGVEPRADEPSHREAKNRRERYGEVDETTVKRLGSVSDEVMARVLQRLRPSRDYVEALLGRSLPWR